MSGQVNILTVVIDFENFRQSSHISANWAITGKLSSHLPREWSLLTPHFWKNASKQNLSLLQFSQLLVTELFQLLRKPSIQQSAHSLRKPEAKNYRY